MGFEKFYFPQLTLIKILLAEGTINSSRQAAELLDQSLNFMRSVHNRRFQIDLLALQSLLFDSQKDEAAALKALTESLTIAEPAGFIRPFVEMGPPMADLLKRLQQQNIAVDYIGSFLDAFADDEQAVVPEAADQPTASTRQFRHPSLLSQPLIDPLSNREQDTDYFNLGGFWR